MKISMNRRAIKTTEEVRMCDLVQKESTKSGA